MKAIHSNSRVAFAYQETEANAYVHNPALSRVGGRNIIRVVQPGDGQASVLRSPNYSGDSETPVDNIGPDRLVSAYVSDIIYKGVGNFADQSGTATVSKPTQSVVHVQEEKMEAGCIIDIILADGALDSVIAGLVGRAHVVLNFESGVVETLSLYLKNPDYLFAVIDPAELSLYKPFSVGVNTSSSVPVGGQTYMAYSTAKAYRKVTSRGGNPVMARIEGAHHDHGDGSLYYTYGQPWGFAIQDAIVNLPGLYDGNLGLVGANIFGGDAIGTATPSVLKWFSLQSDMSATWPGEASGLAEFMKLSTPAEAMGPQTQVDLSKLWEFTPLVSDSVQGENSFNHLVNSPAYSYLNYRAKWGQKFGWYNEHGSNHIIEETGTNLVVDRIAGHAVGTPFHASGFAVTSNGGVPLNVGDTYADKGYHGYAGAYGDDYMENTCTIAGLGTYPISLSWAGNASGGDNNTNAANLGTSLGITSSRLNDVFKVSVATSSRHQVRLGGRYTVGNHQDGTLLSIFSSDLIGTSPYTNIFHVPYAYTGSANYQRTVRSYINNLAIPSKESIAAWDDSGTDLPYWYWISQGSGQVSQAVEAFFNASNFFYAGCANNIIDPYEPVFKGTVRVMYASPSTSGGNPFKDVLSVISQALLTAGVDSINDMDVAGLVLSSTTTTGFGGMAERNYNQVDLASSLLYARLHENGGHRFSSKDTNNIVNAIGARSLTSVQTGEEFGGGLDAPGWFLAAQDIAYLNSAENGVDFTKTGGLGQDNGKDGALKSAIAPYINVHPKMSDQPLRLAKLMNDDQSANPLYKVGIVNFDHDQDGTGFGPVTQGTPWPLPYMINQDTAGEGLFESGNLLESAGFYNGNTSPAYYDGSNASTNVGGVTLFGYYNVPKYISGELGIVAAGGASGTNQQGCFIILGSSCEVKSSDATVTLHDAGNATVNKVSIVYKLRFINACQDNFFKTSGGLIVTSDDQTLAERVTHVLEIFPHIEYAPLSSLIDFPTAQNELQLAYKTVLTDSDDVDNIEISELSLATYELEITISQDANDIFNNPDDDADEDATVEGADVWLDTPMQGIANDSQSRTFGQLYGEATGDISRGAYKGSYITVATTSDFENLDVDITNVFYGENLVYHHGFLTYGQNAQDIEDEIGVANKEGCTDSGAINYDPEAVIDDGSCYDCEDITLENGFKATGLGSGSNGMKVGLTSSAGSPPLTYGLLGDADLPSLDTVFPLPVNANDSNYVFFHSEAAKYGGAVAASNNYANDLATNVHLSVTTQAPTDAAVLELLAQLNGYGENESVWKLRIKLADELLLEALNETGGLSGNSYSVDSPAPSELTDANAIYTATATGGSILQPTWENILDGENGSTLAGLLSGRAYILELTLEPTDKTPATCTSLLADKAKIVSVFWVTFCSCAESNPTNDYLYTAMSGDDYGIYAWQNTIPFPIVGYTGVGSPSCPDAVATSALAGDSDYPVSICYQPDQELSTCDGFFLHCIAQTQIDCATLADITPGLNVENELYTDDEGLSYFLPIVDASITVLIEGVYNPVGNGYTSPEGLEYTVTVTGPGEYSQIQSNVNGVPQVSNSAGASSAISHVFSGMAAAGEYTVTWVYTGPYPADFTGDAPCTYAQTITINNPSAAELDGGCVEIFPGCTDPVAPNYDSQANIDNGTCLPPEEVCQEVWANPSLSVAAVPTNSTSTCSEDSFTVGGVTYDVEIPAADNNGELEVTVTYTPPTAGEELTVNTFAILIFPSENNITGLENVIDSSIALFSSPGFYPTAEATGTTVLPGNIGYYSTLFTVGSIEQDFEHTFTGLPPGVYYAIAIPNFGGDIAECAGEPFIIFEDNIETFIVDMDAPTETCLEACVETPCGGHTPGCTDETANNFNPAATIDDGTCQFDATFCEDPANSNHELCLGCDDANALGAPGFVSTGGRSAGRTADEDPLCDPYNGSDGECTDPYACNYNPDAVVSNNQLCDYCGCDGADDELCNSDDDCDPADPNCQGFEPECPDPGNPACDPVIYDPCPDGQCGPPIEPCLILGNCTGNEGEGGDDEPTFTWEEPVIELTCFPDVLGVDNQDAFFDDVIKSAFQCMSEEGKKMLFKMKAGVDYDDNDLLKMSLVSYLLNGGLYNDDLPCLFNCNGYDSKQRNEVFDAKEAWVKGGARFWNSTDTFKRNEVVVYYYPINGVMTRNIYQASREITPLDKAPRYPGSGWHRLKTVTVRTKDSNGIATGNEEYLTTFIEYMRRFCQSCEIEQRRDPEDVNNVDPQNLPNYLDPKVNDNTTNRNPSGILGEDGDEIIF
mgnify:CR=1 FL=1